MKLAKELIPRTEFVAEYAAVATSTPQPMPSPEELWKTHEAEIRKLAEEAFPELTRLPVQSDQFVAMMEVIKEKLLKLFSEPSWQHRFLLPIVDAEVRSFLRNLKERLWEPQFARAVSLIQQTIPPGAREFEEYYLKQLHGAIQKDFLKDYPESKSAAQLDAWVNELVPTIVRARFTRAVKNGELADEELVKLALERVPNAADRLMERYLPLIRSIVAKIVYSKGKCPDYQDEKAFIEDVAQNVALKVFAKLKTFRFEKPFDHWVKVICRHEAEEYRREFHGREPQPHRDLSLEQIQETKEEETSTRSHISWKELQELQKDPRRLVIRNLEHRQILHKILEKHRAQGVEAAKSTDAIELRHYEDLSNKEVAERLHTTRGYVDQLFSHDKPELQRIALEDFGLSGLDL